MLKKLLLIIPALYFVSCGINYDGTTKIIFEGRIIDASGQPIKNMVVTTYYSSYDDNDMIGVGFTDENGNYKMIFPGADTDVEISLKVNDPLYNNNTDQWSNTTVRHIQKESISDYRINFGTEALYLKEDSIDLQIDIPDNGSGIYITNIELTGLINNKITDYNFPNSIGSNFNNSQFDYQVSKNQTLTLKYVLSDGSISEKQIVVNNEPVIYTLNY